MRKKIFMFSMIVTMLISFIGCSNTKENNTSDSNRSYGNTINNYYKAMSACKYNDEIYFSGWNDRAFYKIKNDGTGLEKLNNDYPKDINIYRNHIYYIDESDIGKVELIKVDLDGKSNKEVLSDKAYSVMIKDNKLMYMDRNNYNSSNFIVVDLNTNKEIKNVEVEGTPIIFDENTFIKDSPTSEYKIFKTDRTVVYEANEKTSNAPDIVNVSEKYIAYMSSSPEMGYFATSMDGRTIKISDNMFHTRSTIIGDDFYYFRNGKFIKLNLINGNVEELFDFEFMSSESDVNNALNRSMFEFDGVIYTPCEDKILPMYNTKTKEIEKVFNDLVLSRIKQ